MIRMWRSGVETDPARGPGADHPLVRWGEGVFETMRAVGADLPLGERHLDRMLSSLASLAIPEPPGRGDLERALGALQTGAVGPTRIRLTAAAGRTVIGERVPAAELPALPASLRAALMLGEWAPGRTTGEHKTLSYLPYRDCARRAVEGGADTAILTDSHGRLGESDRGNLIAVVDGRALTPPVRGILPGIARSWALEARDLVEEPVRAAERGRATEVVMCNAVEGFAAVTTIDGVAVGDGAPGPWVRATQERFSALFAP